MYSIQKKVFLPPFTSLVRKPFAYVKFIHIHCQTQSIFGDTVYLCYCKFRLVTPHGGGLEDCIKTHLGSLVIYMNNFIFLIYWMLTLKNAYFSFTCFKNQFLLSQILYYCLLHWWLSPKSCLTNYILKASCSWTGC